MSFDLKQLETGLAQTKLRFFDEVESTNSVALDLARAGEISQPTLVLCQRQLAGRGQRGNTWWSSEESITMSWCWPASTLLYPQGLLSLAAGLAVNRGITDRLGNRIDLNIKWPNDLIANGKKVAGILVESIATPTATDPNRVTLIFGIGINVNQIDFPAPTAKPNAIPPSSLRANLDGKPLIDVTTLTLSITHSLEDHFIESPLPQSELTDSISRKIFYKHQKICLERPNNDFVFGILQGIGKEGEILIRSEAGTQAFYSGTLRPIDNG